MSNLVLSKNKVSELLETLSLSFLVMDSDYNIVDVNKQWLKMFDLEEGQIIGSNFLKFLPSSSFHHFSTVLNGVEESKSFSMEIDILSKGSVISSICCIRELTDEDVLCIFTNITSYVEQRRVLANQLRQSQKMEAIGVRTGGIAHDFNNVLTPLKTGIDLVGMHLEETGTMDGIRDVFAGVNDAVNTSVEMVGNILKSSKPRHVDFSSIDLKEVVENCFKVLYVPENVKIHKKLCSDRICYVKGDEIQLIRVVSNLCMNAFQAIGSNDGNVKITGEIVRADENRSEVVKTNDKNLFYQLRVEDDGEGMSREVLGKIYDQYTSKENGSGLGLLITKKIVERHGGYIKAKSQIGVGTAFSVYLPFIEQE